MYTSILLSQWVVASDNAIDALRLLCDTRYSGSAEDITAAEKLYEEARASERAAYAAWEEAIDLPDPWKKVV